MSGSTCATWSRGQIIYGIRYCIRFVVLSLGVILGLSNAGYDVAMLIAGLGLGGLAIAIAVQAWLGNVIGGANVFMDRHFSVGDRIQIEGSSGRIDGEVLEIVGMEREHRDEARGIVQTAFARLGDASELRQEWKERPILCEERDLFFRVVEGPADATVHVEWIVTAKVLDDPRARLWLTAVR